MKIYHRIIEATDPRLKRHVHHDSRSWNYAFNTEGLTIQSVNWTRRAPIFDQGNLGSCTGNAGIGCLATDPFYNNTVSFGSIYSLDEDGAVKLYSDATAEDDYPGQYPPEDTGSDGLTIAKVLTAKKLIAGYQHTFTIDDMLKALTQRSLITGTVWYNSMFEPDPGTGVLPVDSSSGVAGGHEYGIVGYNANSALIKFANSWGTSWGQDGFFYMHAEDFADLLDNQGDVTAFVPITQAPPVPTDPNAVLAKAAKPWVQERHIGDNARMAKSLKVWLKAEGF